VLVVNDSLNVGGAERVAIDIANGLDTDRYEVTFCSTRSAGPLAERLRPDIPLEVLGRTATWDLTKLVDFGRLVRSRRIDLIHSHARGTMKFVALARRTRIVNRPHVFHDHFGWLHVDRGASRGLRLALRTEVDAYIGVDSRLCNWALTTVGLPPERVHLVRSGVDLDRFTAVQPVDLRSELGLPSSSTIMVMAANFRPQKDHPTLFRAMAALPPELLEQLELVIVGSTTADVDYHAGCMQMLDRLGLSDRVHLLGSRDDVPEVLAGADAAVLSSKNETGPLVVLEYMAAGLPFVATDTGEITRGVRDLDVGFVPAPRDHHDVADALAALLRMTPEERRAMGRRGRLAAEREFSQERATRQVEQVYRTVLPERTERPLGNPT
jgi:glycosyltransferase involved in cell wall biosynthesis